jgi:hypothetical protein
MKPRQESTAFRGSAHRINNIQDSRDILHQKAELRGLIVEIGVEGGAGAIHGLEGCCLRAQSLLLLLQLRHNGSGLSLEVRMQAMTIWRKRHHS